MQASLPQGYEFQRGSTRERAALLKFMAQTYGELFPSHSDFSHLADTVDRYFNHQTPLWWVTHQSNYVACLWAGDAREQETGDRHAHIFLLYVAPAHRHQGIARALLAKIETWAKKRGDRQISLMVYQHNRQGINLYRSQNYQTRSFWMVKKL